MDCASSLFLASHSLKNAINHLLFIVPYNVKWENKKKGGEKKRGKRKKQWIEVSKKSLLIRQTDRQRDTENEKLIVNAAIYDDTHTY